MVPGIRTSQNRGKKNRLREGREIKKKIYVGIRLREKGRNRDLNIEGEIKKIYSKERKKEKQKKIDRNRKNIERNKEREIVKEKENWIAFFPRNCKYYNQTKRIILNWVRLKNS